MRRLKNIWTVIYSLFLAGFTVYILLDSFVLVREIEVVPQVGNVDFSIMDKDKNEAVNSKVETEEPEKGFVEEPKEESDDVEEIIEQEKNADSEPMITEWSYKDGDISVMIEKIRYKETNLYLADVKISSAQYLKTAFAEGKYGKNITALTSETASENNAIFAVNGDYYGARNTGYVIRNGYLFRADASDREALVIYGDGQMETIAEVEVNAEELLENGAYHVISFGPGMVSNGEIQIQEQYETGKAATKNPRTAIGMISPLHYLFVVTDGRNDDNEGLTVRELAEFMLECGVQYAYNLDGGGSSTMYFNGRVINNPGTNSKKTKEREVSDIVYVGK